ncbi:sugar ABC transporter substrate-binding protein [Rhizobium sp. 1AS11]|uniref:sugar ABC transporter substrate-binding protein n=1 Tax=Rhizobium acaciae TaxID=2989736 RepID=UPI0022238DCA|nr:sugar ABC transporter substrate-binding protein [Rhizobium acaciae]MCW1411261.1 sugar ABC transporter substrate-binding protein [Rhizobium acaciae]MCW1743327.1 sugar ABC transporter substrate-binding protein [Rhizobium acaciae]
MTNIYRRTILIGAAGLAALATTGLAKAQSAKRIGFMIWNTSVPFYSNLIKMADETARKNGISLDIQSGNGDLATQISIVQQFIAQQVDMILIAPSDPKGIVPVIRQAAAANIPVMAVNTKADVSSGAKVLTYVGVDDFVFGQRQGDLIVKAVGEKAKIAYILGKLGTSAQLSREAGLMDTLKKYPGIEILEKQAADWDNSKALAITQDYLSKYPEGAIAAIVDQGPEGVNGANFAALSGRTDVKFILGDYPADVRNAILKGTVYGTVNQDPAPQGSTAIEDAVLFFAGKGDQIPTPNHHLDLPMITKENVEQFKAAWGG